MREAWERLKGAIRGRVAFQSLPLATWGEKAVGFAALAGPSAWAGCASSRKPPSRPFTWSL